MVEEVGEGADPGLRGRRVAFWAMPPAVSGAYAEHAVAPEDVLFLLSDGVSFDQGAALPQQGLTAWGVVHFGAGELWRAAREELLRQVEEGTSASRSRASFPWPRPPRRTGCWSRARLSASSC